MSALEHALKFIWRLVSIGPGDRLRTTRLFIHVRNWVAHRRYRGATHNEIYGDDYFQSVDQDTMRSAGPIADSIMDGYSPATVWDVGCGTGALLEVLKMKGVNGRGLELADAALKYCWARQLDVRRFNILEDTLSDEQAADVVISMEVGAQLPPSGADRYIDLLCRLGPVVLFSAEAPGGGDRLVLNEQPQEYWIKKFAKRGFLLNERRTQEWREQWKAANSALWFCRNAMVFERHA